MKPLKKLVITTGAIVVTCQLFGILQDACKKVVFKKFENVTVGKWTTERDNRLIDTRFEDIIHREGL